MSLSRWKTVNWCKIGSEWTLRVHGTLMCGIRRQYRKTSVSLYRVICIATHVVLLCYDKSVFFPDDTTDPSVRDDIITSTTLEWYTPARVWSILGTVLIRYSAIYCSDSDRLKGIKTWMYKTTCWCTHACKRVLTLNPKQRLLSITSHSDQHWMSAVVW